MVHYRTCGDQSPFDDRKLHPNGGLTTLACGFNKAAGSTAAAGCVLNFRACCDETIVDGADRLKNVKGEKNERQRTKGAHPIALAVDSARH